MDINHLVVVDIANEARYEEMGADKTYLNKQVAIVNDHVVRMSVMTQPYFWHYHPDSDESFLVIEGSLFIDLRDRTVELFPNQFFTIPKNTIHRTRPNSSRSVNLTFESGGMTTVTVK